MKNYPIALKKRSISRPVTPEAAGSSPVARAIPTHRSSGLFSIGASCSSMSVPTPRPALKSEISHFCSHRRVARARDTLGNLRQPQPPPVFSARLVGLANGREAAALAEESVERIAALEIDRRDRHVREYRLDGRNVTRRYTMAVSGWPTCLSWISAFSRSACAHASGPGVSKGTRRKPATRILVGRFPISPPLANPVMPNAHYPQRDQP